MEAVDRKVAANSENFRTAAAWYLKAAQQGHVYAQVALGRLYSEGWGVPKNLGMAADWYQQAAMAGNAEAQFMLADSYTHGHGVIQNFPAAVHWYRRAAEQGHRHAQGNLGTFYRDGLGVPRSAAQSRMWYTRAADQGSERALALLGRPPGVLGSGQRRPGAWELFAGVVAVGLMLALMSEPGQPATGNELVRMREQNERRYWEAESAIRIHDATAGLIGW